MLKLTKFDLEPKWVDSSICFCGGGEDPADDMDGPSAATGSQGYGNMGNMGPGGGQGSNSAASSGVSGSSSSSSSSSTSGGMNEGQDNTGIADAAGYGPGSSDTSSSDSDSLDISNPNAMAAAEVASQKAADKSKDRAVKDAFVTDTSGKPIGTKSGFVSKGSATEEQVAAGYKALGLADPKSDKASQDVEASYGVPVGAPVGIASSPTISAAEVLGISPVESMARFGTPGYAGMTAQAATTAAAADTAQNTADQFSTPATAPTAPSARAPSINASNVLSAVNDLAAQSLASSQGKPGAPSTGIASVAVDSLDRSNPNAMAAAETDSLLGAFGSNVQSGPVSDTQIGIAQAPSISAAEVLGVAPDISNPNAMAAAERAASVSAPASVGTAGLSPGALGGRVANPNAPGQLSAEQLAAMDRNMPSMVDAETDVMARDLDDMNRAGYSKGYPTGLEFATNPQTGAQITTNLAGLTEQQKADQPLSMDIAQFIGSNPYGYEIDPQTGQVIGQVGSPPFGVLGSATSFLQDLFMGPPQNTQDLIERGAYTGMTGQGGDGMTGGGDGDGVDSVAQQPTTDPCPEGYALVDGACTPVSPEEEAAFKFGTDTGVKYFNPFTQATQLGGMNPFVLQPYMPGQNPFAQPSQASVPTGIQAISPTGAALGRQI